MQCCLMFVLMKINFNFYQSNNKVKEWERKPVSPVFEMNKENLEMETEVSKKYNVSKKKATGTNTAAGSRSMKRDFYTGIEVYDNKVKKKQRHPTNEKPNMYLDIYDKNNLLLNISRYIFRFLFVE